jgi:prepilin-type N-terminal cleavage/methylation domain-containing protein
LSLWQDQDRSPAKQKLSRAGFTLIETIISMSLVTLLMAIVWTMFSVYTKLESKGVAAAKESALVRSMDRQLRHDLLHAVGIDTTRRLSIEAAPDQPANSFPSNGYLIGTATDLHFVICSEPISPGTGDHIRVISYQPRSMIEDEFDELEQSGTELEIEVQQESEFDFMEDNATPLGIDRHDRSWTSYTEARTTDDSDQELLNTNRSMTLDADDLVQVGQRSFGDEDRDQRYVEAEDATDEIPEVQRLNFRYFDGNGWTSSWDSTASGSLPMAIEIGFDLEMETDGAIAQASQNTDGLQPNDDSGDRDFNNRPNKNRLSESAPADADTITIDGINDFDTIVITEYQFVVSVPAATAPSPRQGSGLRSDQSDENVEQNGDSWLEESEL